MARLFESASLVAPCYLGGCTNSSFHTQAVVDFGTPGARYRSNLQVEFR